MSLRRLSLQDTPKADFPPHAPDRTRFLVAACRRQLSGGLTDRLHEPYIRAGEECPQEEIKELLEEN